MIFPADRLVYEIESVPGILRVSAEKVKES